jgi:hypothetical protein
MNKGIIERECNIVSSVAEKSGPDIASIFNFKVFQADISMNCSSLLTEGLPAFTSAFKLLQI